LRRSSASAPEATLLHRLLARRFGPLPDWVEDRLRRASIEELADVFEDLDA